MCVCAAGVSVQRLAQRLYEQYVGSNAPFEINLPDRVNAQLRADIKKLNAWKPARTASQMHAVAAVGRKENAQPAEVGIAAEKSAAANSAEATAAPAGADVSIPVADRDGGVLVAASSSLLWPSPPPVELSRLFDGALEEIFNLMQRDSFPRFLHSSLFRALLADEQAADHAEAEPDDVEAAVASQYRYLSTEHHATAGNPAEESRGAGGAGGGRGVFPMRSSTFHIGTAPLALDSGALIESLVCLHADPADADEDADADDALVDPQADSYPIPPSPVIPLMRGAGPAAITPTTSRCNHDQNKQHIQLAVLAIPPATTIGRHT